MTSCNKLSPSAPIPLQDGDQEQPLPLSQDRGGQASDDQQQASGDQEQAGSGQRQAGDGSDGQSQAGDGGCDQRQVCGGQGPGHAETATSQ